MKLMPEGSYPTRELSRQLGNLNKEHWKCEVLEKFVGNLKEKEQ
jgi:hypothetical protein